MNQLVYLQFKVRAHRCVHLRRCAHIHAVDPFSTHFISPLALFFFLFSHSVALHLHLPTRGVPLPAGASIESRPHAATRHGKATCAGLGNLRTQEAQGFVAMRGASQGGNSHRQTEENVRETI